MAYYLPGGLRTLKEQLLACIWLARTPNRPQAPITSNSAVTRCFAAVQQFLSSCRVRETSKPLSKACAARGGADIAPTGQGPMAPSVEALLQGSLTAHLLPKGLQNRREHRTWGPAAAQG